MTVNRRVNKFSPFSPDRGGLEGGGGGGGGRELEGGGGGGGYLTCEVSSRFILWKDSCN